MEQEGAATQTRGMRLHQVQHELHCDRRIHRAAALLEHAKAGIDRERMRGGHHVIWGMGDEVLRTAGGRFRLQRSRDLRCAVEDNQQGE